MKELDEIEEFQESIGVYNEDESIIVLDTVNFITPKKLKCAEDETEF